MVSPTEYDLYMRADTNTRGHHQWFYFKVTNRRKLVNIRFNILNFTKSQSLYEYGMKVCVCSTKEKEKIIQAQGVASIKRKASGGWQQNIVDFDIAGWKRGGKNISYSPSKLNKIIEKNQ